MATAASLLRRLQKKRAREDHVYKSSPASASAQSLNDLDAQITALEREIEDASTSVGVEVEEGESGEVVRLYSANIHERSADRIAPLPAHMLPSPECGSATRSHKRQRKEREPNVEEAGNGETHELEDLSLQVDKRLAEYKPVAAEKRPFYCRVCKVQATSLLEFEEHKATQFHRLASNKERKLSYCKLCKKQFTSPVQLEEHCKGKQHKQNESSCKSEERAKTLL